MTVSLPRLVIPRVNDEWDRATDLFALNWGDAQMVQPFILADGSGPASQQTRARVCYTAQALYVHFDCADRDIWGTYTQRDAPIYDEEVVEVFLAPGDATPVDYYEFEVSPNAVLLDVLARNPTGQRADLQIDFAWDCPGLRWAAGRNDAAQHWRAALAIPWTSVGAAGKLPTVWRGNFYRIERPHGDRPEFSCWSATMSEPADFHRPSYFGLWMLAAAS